MCELCQAANFTHADFIVPHINNVWDFRKKDEYIQSRKYFQKEISRIDLETKSTKGNAGPGLSRVDRQEIQIEKSKNSDVTAYIDVSGLGYEMKNWKFPLHFIDFETTAVAIPFNKGRKPYEQIAFQFSHHVVNADLSIEHRGEWINTKPGYFPNFDFARKLKSELDKDDGTIFRYAAHENTILNKIYDQLEASSEIDKSDLCAWIKTITKSSGSSLNKWEGNRNMIDLRDLVLKYYYNPATNGSNSIKDILPAILNESQYLKSKYSKPIYGSQIKSLNFENKTWIVIDEKGKVKNPYHLLPLTFEGIKISDLDRLIIDEQMGISDGGADMMAYAQMQFTEISDQHRKEITKALLKYGELDTFAMVMIWEVWNNLV